MTGPDPKILVFIPMYNCAAQIPRVLAQFQEPEVARLVHGVLCIDNRSTDGTRSAALEGLRKLDLAETLLFRNDDNYGLGGSHKVAIELAGQRGYTHLIVLHGDDQGSIRDLVPHLADGSFDRVDFLMGARFMPGSRLRGYSALRTLANRGCNLVFSALTGRRLYDLGSGLNLFRVSAFSDGFHKTFSDDLTFNYYLILGIVEKGFRLRFFPLEWREEDQVSNARLARMGRQLLGIMAFRLLARRRFFATDHRGIPRDSYPSTQSPG